MNQIKRHTSKATAMILLWLLAFDAQANISITVGSSKSKQETHTQGTEAVSSTVAGKEVNLIATGAGTNSNIHVQGSHISGTEATRLIADNNVMLESAQNTSEEHSSNKSSGWNAGVVVGTQGIGITAGGNVGKGKGEGTGVTQVNTHVGSQSGQTLVQAGGDTKLAGAQLLGKRVELDTNNLIIESRQDTNKYDSKQMDASAQVTVGYGFSASGSYSQNKINADYASVNEQSGILAGDGGYNVNVKNHTDLKGGIITSTQAAEEAGRNRFSTGTLSASDIQNHADYSASGFGLSGGVSVGAKDSGGTKEDPNTGTKTNLGVGKDNRSLEVTKSIGYGSDSGHDRSVTSSGINTSNISITDVAGQNATGTSVEQIKAQVKTATTTDTVQANSGVIANNFDKDAVQKEIGLQVSVTQQFDNTRQGVKAEINKHIDGLQAELKAAKTLEEKAAIEQKINSWQNVGTLIDMIAGGLSAPTSSALGIAAATAAPAVQYQIGQIFKDNQAKNELDKLMTGTAGTRPEEGSALHVLAHTVLAAAVAAAGGNDALTAGLSAGGAELLAPKVANWLYGNTAGVEKDESGNVIASKLTAEQKQTVSNIVSLGAAGLTAGAGGTGVDVAQGAQLAGSAVEDNYLNPAQRVFGFDAVNNQLARLQGHALTREQYEKRLMELAPTSEKMNKQMVADCLGGKASCSTQKAQAEEYMAWIKAMEDKGFLTPGKFGNGTAEALQQVAAMDQPSKATSVSNLSSNGFDITKNTKPPVIAGFIIDDSYIPDVGDLSVDQLYARAAQNGLSPNQLDAWMKTLPTQSQVCSGMGVSEGCSAAYVKNMTRLVSAYPGVPISQLINQLNFLALESKKGNDSYGKIAWDAAGQFFDLSATVNKTAGALATTKTVIDITYDVYNVLKDKPDSGSKLGFDITSESTKLLVEKAIESEFPNFKNLPENQKRLLTQSVLNGISLIQKENEPR